ncbi:hypothetical protein IGI04_019234, partial [Brassica rapa subsp. trilocularis]
DFGPGGLSVQYTHDVRGCPSAHTGVRRCLSAHTGRPWLSVCVRQQPQDVRGCPSVHISACWSLDSARWPIPWTVRVILAHVACLFSIDRTSVGVRQHTQDVRVCPSAHTGRPWLSVCVRQHTQDVRGWPSVHISALHKGRPLVSASTQDVRGCPCVSVCVCLCPSAHTGRPLLSISTHISMLVLELSTLALPMDCLGDFWPTWAVCSVHTGCPWVSASTQRTSVAVCGCPSAHTGRLWRSVCVRVSPSAHTGCPWVSVSTHRTSVCVCQYTQDVRGCPCVSVCVRQHTQDVCGCPFSTHISMLVLGLRTLTLPVDCSGDFGPRGLSVQYTQDVRGCPPAHTGSPWLSVCVCVCPSVSVSTHITAVAVHQYTYQHHTQDVRGCPSAHTGRPCVSVSTHRHTRTATDVCGRPSVSVCVRQHTQDVCGCPSVLGLSTLALPVDCLGDFGPRGLSVQYTQDVYGCPPAHTGHLWLSVAVRRPWLSISTHISTLVLGLSTLTLPVDCSGDFGPHGLSVQYTKDVRGCLPAHTGRPWLSVCVVYVRQHTQDVRGCPSVHISARWPFPWTVRVILAHMGCLFSTHRASVSVRQHTQDICGCPCVSVSTHRTSVAVHQYTYQHAGPWTQHAGPSCGLFG